MVKTQSVQTDTTGTAELPIDEPKHSDLRSVAAVLVLVAAAFFATLTLVGSYDTFWHLAAGEWMFDHGRVTRYDMFCVPENPEAATPWVNIHWFFQIVLTSVHSVLGFAGLSLLKALLAATTFGLLAWSLRKHIPPSWLIFVGLLAIYVMARRFRARPESFTMLFMMIVILLTDSVRRGRSPRRLWWLVPLMVVWVNMHGLFVLGLGLMWMAVLGAFVDGWLKRDISGHLNTQAALAPVLAATFAVFVSPWPTDTALHPLLLATRITGQQEYYTYVVSELRPTYERLGNYPGAIVLTGVCLVSIVMNRRKLPVAHGLWFLAFVTLALLAIRNVALAGPVLAFLSAWHGGKVIRRLLAGRRLGKLPVATSAVAMVLGVLLMAAYATEWMYRVRGHDTQFGMGMRAGHYPVASAGFLRDLDHGGDVFCMNFGDSATFVYKLYSGRLQPRRLVFMDGRLEVHSLERFREQRRIQTELYRASSANTIRDLPPSVRYFYVARDNSARLTALAASYRFDLLYVGPGGAVFARNDWEGAGPEKMMGKFLPEPNWDDWDKPLTRDYIVKGIDPQQRAWYDQNPQPRYLHLGSMFLALGQRIADEQAGKRGPHREQALVLAVRYLRAARSEGLADDDLAGGLLAQAYQQKSFREDIPGALPLDVQLARALHLYRQMDIAELSDRNIRELFLQKLVAHLQANQLDEAQETMDSILANLPPRQQVDVPTEYLNYRNQLTERLDVSQAQLMAMDMDEMDFHERISALISPKVGLVGKAIAELQAAPSLDFSEELLLGDLLLRTGRPTRAREVYESLLAQRPGLTELTLRVALTDWAAGKLFEAEQQLAKLADATDEPAADYYHAALLEQLGRRDRARQRLLDVRGASRELNELVDRMRMRLR
ncbi:MAG: hypothetical protein ACLFVU_01810 [Phycisphaerae bacterium]